MVKSFVVCLFLFLEFAQTGERKIYVLIHIVTKEVPGFAKKLKVAEIDKVQMEKLSKPLKARAAYYGALAGSNCDGKNCELTSSLGLGAQGSDEHKELIRKWFPKDTVAIKLIAQNCFQPSSGSSYFTNYSSLVFEVANNTVLINYTVIKYDHGKSSIQKHQDKATIMINDTILIRR
jgi:hypothetical protein